MGPLWWYGSQVKDPSAKAECGFRTTPEECLYDSGSIEPSV